MRRFARAFGVLASMAAAATATYVSTASAGAKLPFPIVVNPILRVASGGFGTVRNSLDSSEYIYCTVTGTAAGLLGQCVAHDASPISLPVSCTTTNANLIGAMQELPPDAYVAFAWNAVASCTSIQIINGSRLELKKP
jgi:hypothetical protein